MQTATAARLPTGTVTFLFSDIEGSTRLLAALGDRYPPMLEAHAEILRGAIGAHEGTVVNTEGDSFFAVFRPRRAPSLLPLTSSGHSPRMTGRRGRR